VTISDVIVLGREALWVAVMLAGPLLGGILIAGVVIGIVQAATSIQEMTLSFVPKLIFIVVALLVIGNWQINLFVDYIERVFLLIPVMLQ
jgi:flagellar biosynthetic protein FliQ